MPEKERSPEGTFLMDRHSEWRYAKPRGLGSFRAEERSVYRTGARSGPQCPARGRGRIALRTLLPCTIYAGCGITGTIVDATTAKRRMNSGKRVLVVDDNGDFRSIITTFLEAEGFQVCELEDESGLHEVIQRTRPDILILDIMLQHSDGRDICRQLKGDRNTKSIRVIMMSAAIAEGSRGEVNCGADDYFSKPVDVGELARRVHQQADIIA